MKYQVLALKWRPQRFEEVVGQSAVVQTLTQTLSQQRLHHAYLLTGTRGVGKTSLARILAKSFCCEQGITPTPCGQCSACVGIAEGHFPDVIEVDAASRTKVEDTKELLDSMVYAPVQGRFKVYIIDEVHMLSTHSFNALLKTLEEPPAHVKFIFATTDPQKLPITVLSRCLQFQLKHLSSADIFQQLTTITQQEQIACDPAALQRVSEAADGSMRDALSLLEQLLAFAGKSEITQEIAEELLGVALQDRLLQLLERVIANRQQEALMQARSLVAETLSVEKALQQLQSLLHHIILCQLVPDGLADNLLDRRHWPKIQALAEQIHPDRAQLLYQTTLTGIRDLPYVSDQPLGFEMVVLRMLAFLPVHAQPITELPEMTSKHVNKQVEPQIQGKLRQPEPASAHSSSVETSPQTRVLQHQPSPRQVPNVIAKPSAPSTASSDAAKTLNWNQIVVRLRLTGLTKVLAEHCVVTAYEPTAGTLELSLQPAQKPLLNDKQRQKIEAAISQALHSQIKLTIVVAELTHEPPAVQAHKQAKKKQQRIEKAVNEHKIVQSMIETFGATIESVQSCTAETH